MRNTEGLEDVFANVVGERSCQLFTVLGPAGVGKSRLVTELVRTLDDAEVVRGRCPSSGRASATSRSRTSCDSSCQTAGSTGRS